MSVETFKGVLHVAKISSQYPTEDYVEIEITDDLSSITFLTIKLSLDEAAKAIFFSGRQDVELKFLGREKIGMKRENKTERIAVGYQNWDEDYERLVAEHEVDGWTARRESRINSHRHNKDGYSVGYTRWVEVDDDSTEV